MSKPPAPSALSGSPGPGIPGMPEPPPLRRNPAPPVEDPSTALTRPFSSGPFDEPITDRMIGSRVGPYRIVQEIGHGGMGTVYRALRADPEFQIEVAIKVVRRGMDSHLVLERFRTERQILARLEHPYIGRLLDGGTTDEGLAYFLMEYIDGQPLTRYCDSRQLSVSERIQLFRKVCDAVSHAHQNLIIHRDLKPDNILVTSEGVPKLLDFGIAKLLDPPTPGEENQPTMTMVRLGTPAYSSPEQIRGGAVGIPADVYSLGVVLYELLTGQRPYRIDSLGWEESARVICERDATRPSALVGNKSAASVETQEISRCRGTTVEGLRKRLSGDLDNILAVALRKDPSRRYRSVDQLSEELQRHLEGRPVKARGDSLVYKAGKLIGRHKLAAASALIFTLLLAGAGAFAAWQAQRLSTRLAEDRQLASSFLVDVHDQIAMLPGATPAREALLAKSVDYLNGLARQSDRDPQLRRSLALAYERFADLLAGVDGAGLGRSAQALKTYEAARTLREALALKQPHDAKAQYDLASNYLLGSYITGRIGTLSERLACDNKALAISESLLASDPGNVRYQALVAKAYTSAAYGLSMSDRWSDATSYFRKAAVIRRQLSAANPNDLEARRELANIYYRLGVMEAQSGQPREALPNLRQALQLQTTMVLPEKHDQRIRSEIASTHHFLGIALGAAGDLPSALAHFGKAIAIREAVLAVDKRDVRTRALLAGNYAEQSTAQLRSGRKTQALASIRRALVLQQQLLAVDAKGVPARFSLADYQSRLAAAYAALGQIQGAVKASAASVAVYDELDREGHLGAPDARSDAQKARADNARYASLLK